MLPVPPALREVDIGDVDSRYPRPLAVREIAPSAFQEPSESPHGMRRNATPPVARWGDAVYAIVLYRTASYGEGFRLIVTESVLDDLARKATSQGTRFDEQDAPRVEAPGLTRVARELPRKRACRRAAPCSGGGAGGRRASTR